jgi:hypothetical protein
LDQRASRELADEGYVRLAVARYRGKVAKKVPDDLHAVVEFLGSQCNVKKDCLGSISNGRGYSLNLALQESASAAEV